MPLRTCETAFKTTPLISLHFRHTATDLRLSVNMDACTDLRQGGKALSEGTFMHLGILWSSNSLLEGQYLVYWSRSYTMVSFGYLQIFLESKCLQRWKKLLHNIREMARAQYQGREILTPTPMEEGSCLSYPPQRRFPC